MTECKASGEAYNAAILFLSRREHSVYELEQKLAKYGVDEINHTIAYCISLGLQSDLRFAEMLCRTRVSQGHGPRRIAQDLQKARVSSDIIAQVILSEQDNWVEHGIRVWTKKYRNKVSNSPLDRRKQQQFLLSRGFEPDTITHVMKHCRSLITNVAII